MPDSDCHRLEIDTVLGPVAQALPRQADLILDIRQAALERKHPGACVRCFFELSAAASEPERLEKLRAWLERNIEIVAHDIRPAPLNRALLECFPLNLSGEDLESYCQQVMERFRHDRAHAASQVEMEFRYRAAGTADAMA
ncbi:hypothetical protein OH491_07875 [Termitidicoccus mucosus]